MFLWMPVYGGALEFALALPFIVVLYQVSADIINHVQICGAPALGVPWLSYLVEERILGQCPRCLRRLQNLLPVL